MITLEITCDKFDELTKELGIMFDGSDLRNRNERGGRGVEDGIREFYNSLGSSFWKNESLPTHGAGRKESYWHKRLAENWHLGEVTESSVNIWFGSDQERFGLGMKITGGRIVPLNAKALTIPMTPKAHGVSAREFSNAYGDLFRPKGKDYLAYNDERGEFTVAYLLRSAIDVKPWAGAFPDDEVIVKAFWDGFFNES